MPTKKEIRKENKRIARTNPLSGFEAIPTTYLCNYETKSRSDPYDNFTVTPVVMRNGWDQPEEGYGYYWFRLYECKSDEPLDPARILYEYHHRGSETIKKTQSDWVESETTPLTDVKVLLGNVGWNVLHNIRSVMPSYIKQGKISGVAWKHSDGTAEYACFELLGTNRFFIINGYTS